MGSFGEIFGKSWGEYKNGFWTFLPILLIFSIIPGALIGLASIYYQNFYLGDVSMLILFILLFVGVLLLELLATISIIYYSLYNKKRMSVRESLIGGKKYFWRYLGLILLMTLVIIGIMLIFVVSSGLFIIPVIGILLGILVMLFAICWMFYLLIKWAFGSYLLVGENKGIVESLKESSKIVKGRWWNVFGYLLLLGLIIAGISILFTLPTWIINSQITAPYSDVLVRNDITVLPLNVQISTTMLNNLGDGIGGIIIGPLSILFAKNLFLSLRKKKVAKKKVKK